MKREGMPTQRHEEKRVEKCCCFFFFWWGGCVEREKERTCRGQSKRKSFGSSFCMIFPPPGPALCRLGLARSAVGST